MYTLQAETPGNTRFVATPLPTDPSTIIPSIFGILLKDNQEVEWQWLELPDGNRVVTGYQIKIKED